MGQSIVYKNKFIKFIKKKRVLKLIFFVVTIIENHQFRKSILGNDIRFKEIYNKLYLPLKSYALRFIPDREIIEDFIQDAFLNIWERRENFTSILAIKSFLYTNVKNSCLIHLRCQKIQARNEEEIVRLIKEEEEFIFEEEVYSMLHEAIKDLPKRTREIILMSMEGKPNSEISEHLDISINTIKTIKLRAYRILREKLKEVQWLWFLLI